MQQITVGKQGLSTLGKWNEHVLTADPDTQVFYLSRHDSSDEMCFHKLLVRDVTLYPNLKMLTFTDPSFIGKETLIVRVTGKELPVHRRDTERVHAFTHPPPDTTLSSWRSTARDDAASQEGFHPLTLHTETSPTLTVTGSRRSAGASQQRQAPEESGSPSQTIDVDGGASPQTNGTQTKPTRASATASSAAGTGASTDDATATQSLQEQSLTAVLVPTLSAVEGPVGDRGENSGIETEWILWCQTMENLESLVAVTRAMQRPAYANGAMLAGHDAGAGPAPEQPTRAKDSAGAALLPRIVGDLECVKRKAIAKDMKK